VRFRYGDGTNGWPEEAPFDRVLIAAGAPQVPRALLLGHLDEGGVAVLPVGAQSEQMLMRITRRGDDLEQEPITPVRFVKLIGKEGWTEDEKP